MDVNLSKAITVNMPEGPVHLNAGLNVGVADDVAAHWYVKQHETEPPKPSATETAMQLEINYQTARAAEAEGKLLTYQQRADAAEQEVATLRDQIAHISENSANAELQIADLSQQLANMQAERDGHSARADAAEAKLKQSKTKREQELEAQIAALEGGAAKSDQPPSA